MLYLLLHGILLSILTCLCWGSTSVCLRGLKDLDAVEMSFLRSIGGFAASVPLAFLFSSGPGLFSIPALDVGVLIALVLFNNIIGDVFLFLSLHRLGVARGASISSTYPVVVAILSSLWFGENLTLEREILDFGLGLINVVQHACKPAVYLPRFPDDEGVNRGGSIVYADST